MNSIGSSNSETKQLQSNYDVALISSDPNTITKIKTSPSNTEQANQHSPEHFSIDNIQSTSQNFEENSHFNKAFSNSNDSSLRTSLTNNSLKVLYSNNNNNTESQDKEYLFNRLQQLSINPSNLAHKANSFRQKANFYDKEQIAESLSLDKQLQKDLQFEKKLKKLRRAYRRRKRQAYNSNNSDSDSSDTSSLGSLNMYMKNEQQRDKKLSLKEVLLGKRARKLAFWFIVAFLAALTVKDVICLVGEYMQNGKKSDMNIMFNETMTMPNITFCMSRAQAWSHFKINTSESMEMWDQQIQDQLMNMTDKESFMKKPWDYRMVMETYNLIAALTSMERETTVEGSASSIQKFGSQARFKTIRQNLKMWLDIINEMGISFEEFTQKVGKETLRRSMQRFQRTSYKEDEIIKTQVRISWISQLQLCFQPLFDEENFKGIEDQGNFFVMVLSHNAEKLDGKQVECMSIDFHGRPSSNSRFSGHKGSARDGFNDELCMGMVHETTVEVKASYSMLPNTNQGTACKAIEDGEDSEFDCYARCRMDFIHGICNCTPPTLSYLVDKDVLEKMPLCDYSQCNIDVQKSNYTDHECTSKCLRSCKQIRYEIDHERKGKSVRPDLTSIYLNWGSFEYLTLEQDWVWSVSSFIAAIGGSIGMWLGLSILSLIQGGTYMYSYVHENVISKKLNRNVATTSVSNKKSVSPSEEDERIAAKNPFSSPFKVHKHSCVQEPNTQN